MLLPSQLNVTFSQLRCYNWLCIPYILQYKKTKFMLIIAKNHTDSETWRKRWWSLAKMLRKWWRLRVGLVGFLLFTFYCIILTCLETRHIGVELGTKFHVSHFTTELRFLSLFYGSTVTVSWYVLLPNLFLEEGGKGIFSAARWPFAWKPESMYEPSVLVSAHVYIGFRWLEPHSLSHVIYF